MAKRRCKAKTKKGKPCRAHPVGPNEKGLDPARCMAHQDKEAQDSVGFGGAQAGAGRPRKPRPDEVLRERIEANIDRWLQPLEDALNTGKPVVLWDSAAGAHHIEYVGDPELGMKALKLALDRAYGKPRQIIEGGDGDRPVRISAQLLTDPELRNDLRDLKRRLADSRPVGPGGPGAGDQPAPRRRRSDS